MASNTAQHRCGVRDIREKGAKIASISAASERIAARLYILGCLSGVFFRVCVCVLLFALRWKVERYRPARVCSALGTSSWELLEDRSCATVTITFFSGTFPMSSLFFPRACEHGGRCSLFSCAWSVAFASLFDQWRRARGPEVGLLDPA